MARPSTPTPLVTRSAALKALRYGSGPLSRAKDTNEATNTTGNERSIPLSPLKRDVPWLYRQIQDTPTLLDELRGEIEGATRCSIHLDGSTATAPVLASDSFAMANSKLEGYASPAAAYGEHSQRPKMDSIQAERPCKIHYLRQLPPQLLETVLMMIPSLKYLDALLHTEKHLHQSLYVDRHRSSSLIWAARNGQNAMTRLLLLVEGLDLNHQDEYGQTALSHASTQGHETVVITLLAAGCTPDLEDVAGRTPLLLAAENGHCSIVNLLLGKCADPNSRALNGQTPLIHAAENGHTAIVRLLLTQLGIQLNHRDIFGQTAVLAAAHKGHEDVVQALLAQDGVDPNCRDNYGITPLMWAAVCGKLAVVKLLVKQDGICLNLKDRYGRTALLLAAATGWQPVVELLVTISGVDLRSKDIYGRTAQPVAAEASFRELADFLEAI